MYYYLLIIADIEDTREDNTVPYLVNAPMDKCSLAVVFIFLSGYCIASLSFAVLISTFFESGSSIIYNITTTGCGIWLGVTAKIYS